jgi:hypothetical protein
MMWQLVTPQNYELAQQLGCQQARRLKNVWCRLLIVREPNIFTRHQINFEFIGCRKQI